MLQTEEQCDYFFKIVLVGDCDVGKTCIWKNYVKNQSSITTVPTVGVEFEIKHVTLPDGSKVKAQIWDTGKVFPTLFSHFRKAVGALLVYDICSKATLDNLSKWLEDLRQQAEPDILLYLVGNKLDLVQKEPLSRQVMESDAKLYAKQNNCKSFEVSALTTENLQACFDSLLQDLCKQRNGFRGGEQSQVKLMRQSIFTQEKKCKC